ncbi:40S ribosomal protein S15a-2 [Acorus calamus]|uniref:40S ribosomal protein S15a-2 n=1 Tax=Acorus calamus TaxID=4465 RepID=A0AAV9CMQ9_ACOCL|nr:40S ribosomal protein S15a-2 [Acorus calamus]
MGRRILNEALRKMVNADKRGMATAQLQPISNVMVGFLNIMKERGLSVGVTSIVDWMITPPPFKSGSLLHTKMRYCRHLL